MRFTHHIQAFNSDNTITLRHVGAFSRHGG